MRLGSTVAEERMPEIERKLRVHDVPHLGDGTRLRQAYLAVDGAIEVRGRDRVGTDVLGVKGGRGLERTEVEVEIDTATFDQLWNLALSAASTRPGTDCRQGATRPNSTSAGGRWRD
jgi:hypothetical protein